MRDDDNVDRSCPGVRALVVAIEAALSAERANARSTSRRVMVAGEKPRGGQGGMGWSPRTDGLRPGRVAREQFDLVLIVDLSLSSASCWKTSFGGERSDDVAGSTMMIRLGVAGSYGCLGVCS